MNPFGALGFQLVSDIPFQPPRNAQRIERGRAAIRNQAVSGDGGRLVRREEEHDLRYLLRLCRIAARIKELLSPDLGGVVRKHLQFFLREHPSGRQCVGADAVRTVGDRQALRKVNHARLGWTVR